MKRVLIGLICVGFLGVGALIASHLQRPLTDVTVVTIHATIDPAIARGSIWIGEEDTLSRQVEVVVRGRALQLPDRFKIWDESFETIARTIPPHATLSESSSTDSGSATNLLIHSGEYPIRGIRGNATWNGETSSWLWLVVGDPDGVRVSGVALRALGKGESLIPRDVILPVERPRKQSALELLLTRQRVMEQRVDVVFTRAR